MSVRSGQRRTEARGVSATASSLQNVRSSEAADADSPDLAAFRSTWRAELARRNRQSPDSREQPTDEGINGNEQKSSSAIRLFEAGVAHEREGRMQQAIRCYKQALKMYPDVEKMVFLNSSLTTGLSLKAIEECRPVAKDTRSPDEEESVSTGEAIKNLEERLYREGLRGHCDPDGKQERMHVSALPSEVILRIFRWVISSDLDVQQLEKLALVCSGFYKLARDPELWRSICERVWGQRLGRLGRFSSWRDMFINRCRPCFNGIYVSKISYPRMGENSFNNPLYRPWHKVVYFRCLRFFPDRTATMITTADSPQAIVQYLKTKKPKCPTAMAGKYNMEDDEIVKVTFIRKLMEGDVNRQNARHQNIVKTRQFSLALEVRSTDRLRDSTLLLTNYEAMDHYVSGRTGPWKFHVNERNFPPFHFCPVRSYTALSEAAL